MSKISDLPPLSDTALDGSEQVPAVKGGATYRATINQLAKNSVFTVRGKNWADPALIKAGKYFSPGNASIVGSTAYRSIGPIPVEPGQILTVSGIESGSLIAAAENAGETAAANFTNLGSATTTNGVVQKTITVPANRHFLWVNLTNDGHAVTTYDSTVQVELGQIATPRTAFRRSIDRANLVDGDKLPVMVLQPDKNLIDPAKVDVTRRHSTGSRSIIPADANLIAMTDWIKVEPGELYIVHGAGFYNEASPQGGFYAAHGDTAAVSNITWGAPPTGAGKIFQVPESGVEYVVISLATSADATPANRQLAGPVQMEKGEVATDFEAFAERLVVSEANLPAIVNGGGSSGGGGGGTAALNDAAWFKYVEGEPQPYNRDKWPEFSQRMLLKDKDVCVVSTGTSLTARSTEHHSDHPRAKNRPPLMHSLNLPSLIWDKLAWHGQQYARYDDADVVTESAGVWATSHNLPEWDDGAYRHGLTRYSAADGAAVAFAVPAGAYAWRFIHRTDTIASQQIAVAVSDGDGNVEVFDEGSQLWVEANGYSFSQREAAPVARDVSIPNPDTDVFATSNIATKGNTTYQKRLKFRAIDRSAARSLTFTNQDAGTRFNFWGCEWSPREFMVTYVNASRGSHNTQATGATGLPRIADNEIHGFKPDLIFGELPIHNDGAAGITVYPTSDRWGRLANNYVWRADYELSLATRAATFGYAPEFGFWTPTIADNFGGIGADGQLLTSQMGDGVVMSALDKFDQAVAWMRANHPEAVIIHAVNRWVEAGFAIYGGMKAATIASSRTGPSMTNDGSHPNDVGSRVLAKIITGPLDFGA